MNWNNTFVELTNKANEGDLEAQTKLHDLYCDNRDEKQEFNQELVEFYKKGANENKPYSLYYYSVMHFAGYGMDKDEDKAIELLKKSMEYNCSEAYYMAAVTHLAGVCHFSTYKDLLDQAMDMNNANAYIESARDYDSQNNDKMAIKHYKKAIELGSKYAIYKLGEFYHDREKYVLAKKYYKEAIKHEVHHAYFNLAVMYHLGEGYRVQRNDKWALELFHKAVELGNTRAMVNIAQYHEYNGNEDDAIKYYQMAIDEGKDPAAYRGLGKIYLKDKEIKKAIKLIVEGAREGDPECEMIARNFGILNLDWNDEQIDRIAALCDTLKHFGAADY